MFTPYLNYVIIYHAPNENLKLKNWRYKCQFVKHHMLLHSLVFHPDQVFLVVLVHPGITNHHHYYLTIVIIPKTRKWPVLFSIPIKNFFKKLSIWPNMPTRSLNRIKSLVLKTILFFPTICRLLRLFKTYTCNKNWIIYSFLLISYIKCALKQLLDILALWKLTF